MPVSSKLFLSPKTRIHKVMENEIFVSKVTEIILACTAAFSDCKAKKSGKFTNQHKFKGIKHISNGILSQ